MADRLAPLVVIVGETASGKSQLALNLAKKLDGEIICADSWTVYRGFDVGTAKPTISQQAEVAHHLIDVADPLAGFSAPQFQRLALAAINDIACRNKLAIMVGGTGLYIDSVIYNYSFLPASGNGERARLNSLELTELLDLARENNLPLETIDIRNRRRVIRLIENDGQLPTKASLRSNTLLLGLSLPREELERKVTTRVDGMLGLGLEREVAKLARLYGWDSEAMKGVGYWQWRRYFEGTQTLEETRERIIKATMDLAKKQRTWFKRNKSIHWLNYREKFAQSVELITTILNK